MVQCEVMMKMMKSNERNACSCAHDDDGHDDDGNGIVVVAVIVAAAAAVAMDVEPLIVIINVDI